ncbi:MAG: hypothetical protein M0Z66_09890 [Thermaerobacter sp.]|nr:hypothetical protein [Thermaerobacter sp.]
MKTCPTCRASAPDDERVCHSCGSPFPVASVHEDARVVQLRQRREAKEREEARRYWQQQKRQAQAHRAQSAAWGYWRASPATLVLMAFTLVLSIAAMAGLGGLFYSGGFLQIVMLLFVNPGILGIVLSLLFLYFVGGALEREVPLLLFLIVFFGSGLIGDLAEMSLNMLPIGLGPSLWGMVGALYAWGRLRGAGGYSMQWLTSTIIFTLVLNLVMLNFNIGALLVQIVLTILIGAAIVYLWTLIPGTRRMR